MSSIVVDGFQCVVCLFFKVVRCRQGWCSAVVKFVAELPEFVPVGPNKLDDGWLPLVSSRSVGVCIVVCYGWCMKEVLLLCLPFCSEPSLKDIEPPDVVLLLNKSVVLGIGGDGTGLSLFHPGF